MLAVINVNSTMENSGNHFVSHIAIASAIDDEGSIWELFETQYLFQEASDLF